MAYCLCNALFRLLSLSFFPSTTIPISALVSVKKPKLQHSTPGQIPRVDLNYTVLCTLCGSRLTESAVQTRVLLRLDFVFSVYTKRRLDCTVYFWPRTQISPSHCAFRHYVFTLTLCLSLGTRQRCNSVVVSTTLLWWYSCPRCGSQFTRRTTARSHIRAAHSGQASLIEPIITRRQPW